MDNKQKEILKLLSEDSRLTARQIASATGYAEKEVAATIRNLEESGVIVKYTAILNDSYADDEVVEALIEVKVTPQKGHGFDAIAEVIASQDEVQNLYLMSGAYDLAVIVKGKSLREVSRFVSEKISTFDSVISTATHFILKKYKVEGATMTHAAGADRMSVQA